MKLAKFLSIILISIFIFSCNQNVVYKKYIKSFTDYKWKSDKVCEYNPTIEDTVSNYNITFSFRHIYGFQYAILKVNMEIISPSGKTTNKDYSIQIVDKNNKYLADCAGDYCDLDQIIEENYKFTESGTYIFKIKQIISEKPIRSVMEVGIIIEKVE